MVDVDKAIIARLKKGGHVFEVLVDCDNALAFKAGKAIDMADILAVQDVFEDSKKGMRAAKNIMVNVFGTSDRIEIAKQIILKGDMHLTAEHHAKIVEQKRKQIIGLIHMNAVDPQTGYPHPAERIDLAMKEAKVRIDEKKSVEDQIQDVLKSIRAILPIKFESVRIEIKIPVQHAEKTFRIAKKYGKVIKELWLDDSSWFGILEIPAGMQDELHSIMNKMTNRTVEIRTVKTM